MFIELSKVRVEEHTFFKIFLCDETIRLLNLVHIRVINGSACCSRMHWPPTTITLLYPQLPSPFCFFKTVSKLFPRKSINQFATYVSTCLPNLIVCSRYKRLVLCSHHSQQLQMAIFQVERSLVFFPKLPSDWESISSASPGLSSDNFF